MSKKTTYIKTSTSRLFDGGPGCLARPIQRHQSICPQYLKLEIRLTKKEGEVRSNIPLACHSPEVLHEALMLHTRHSVEDWAVYSKLTHQASRRTRIQDSSNKSNRSAYSQSSSVQNRVHQTRTAPSQTDRSSTKPGKVVQDKVTKGQPKKESPPTQQCQQNN